MEMKKHKTLLISSIVAMVLFSGCVDAQFHQKETVMANYNAKNQSAVEVESELANYTLSSKMDTYKTVGQIRYETSYNGIEPDGCEYASVTKRNMQRADMHNFKQCFGGNIAYIGKTGVEELTDEAKEQLKSISRSLEASCKLQNQATANINEFTAKCFKNPYNNFKFIILKHGKLITKGVGE